MDAHTVSNRELARQLGVSETAVRRAEKAGRIKREGGGAWDFAKVRAARSDNTDQAQQRPARSGRATGNRRTLKPVPEAAVGAVRDTLREHGEPVSAGGMTFMQARTANEVLKAQERRLYEAFLEGIVLFAVLAVLAHRPGMTRRTGLLTGMFFLGYGASRVFVELFREPDAHLGFIVGPLTMGQILSIPMILIGVYLIVRAYLNGAPATSGDGRTLQRG